MDGKNDTKTVELVTWAGWTLANAGFLSYSEDVVRIAEAFDAQAIPLAEPLAALRALNVRLTDFIVESRRSPKTHDIARLDGSRDRLLNVVCRAAASLAKLRDSGPFAAAARKLDAWLSGNRHDARRGLGEETALIDAIQYDYVRDAAVRDAAETLGLARIIERLFAVNAELAAACAERSDAKQERAVSSDGATTITLRKAAAAKITEIFAVVRACLVIRRAAAVDEAAKRLAHLASHYRKVASHGGRRSAQPQTDQTEAEDDVPQP